MREKEKQRYMAGLAENVQVLMKKYQQLGYAKGFQAGQQSIACCGACKQFCNISVKGQFWVCTHEGSEYSPVNINYICDNFEPRIGE